MPVPFISYAQHGEDVVLARALRPDDRPGTWIDVGANHPTADSVTKAFSLRGWAGVNVEPLPAMHRLLVEDRPNDVNLAVAVGAEPGRATLHAGPGAHQGNATLVDAYAEAWSPGDEAATFEVDVVTLADIVRDHVTGEVDFCKVDAEGFEEAVLRGGDWSTFRPRIVLVEATEPNSPTPSHASWEPILLDAGYVFALFDGLNRFYVRGEERELAEVISAPANPLDGYVTAREWDAVADAGRLRQQLAEARAELDALQRSRTVRWTRNARALHGKARARLRR